MEILPITIAEPRADRIGTPADEAKDGWFGELLQASDDGSDIQGPATGDASEPDRATSHDRPEGDKPTDDRPSATAPTGDQDAVATGDLSAQREGPTDKAAAATPAIESLPEPQAGGSSGPAAKVPPLEAAPGSRAGSGQGAQLTATTPAERTVHMWPRPSAAPAGSNGMSAPVSGSGSGPGAAPEHAPSGATTPPPQARIRHRIESRPNGPAAEPSAKPSAVREGAARKDPAVAKRAAASNKASAVGEPPGNSKVQRNFGTLSGLTAAGPRPAANGTPTQPPGTTAATLGPGLSAASGNPAPAEARPAAPPAGPPGGATEQVALRIHKAIAGGQERISIKLHPAELGRIEVKLAWSDDGLMRAMISADKGETLELLQRDSRALERTLQDAGIKTDSGSLNFDLRGQNGRGGASDDPGPQTADSNVAGSEEAEGGDIVLPPSANHSLHRGLLDLSV